MILNISFAELGRYLGEHYNVGLAFKEVGIRVLGIIYQQKLPFGKTLPIQVKLEVVKVTDDTITLGYQGGVAGDLVVKGGMTFLSVKVPELYAAITLLDDHKLCLDLSRLSSLKAVVEALALKDIRFLNSSLEVTTALK